MEHAEYMREWRKKNREKSHGIARKCYQKHKKQVIVKASKYYKENKEKVLSKRMERYNSNLEENRKYNRAWGKQHTINAKKQIEELFGNKCFFCGSLETDGRKNRHNLHEIHGMKHLDLESKKGLEYLEEHKEDFRALCSFCHTGTHFLMKFGYLWEEIEILIKKKVKA